MDKLRAITLDQIRWAVRYFNIKIEEIYSIRDEKGRYKKRVKDEA